MTDRLSWRFILQDIFGEKYSDESGGITFEEFVRAMVARSEQNKRFHSALLLSKTLNRTFETSST